MDDDDKEEWNREVSCFMGFCVLCITKGNPNMKGGLFMFYIPFLVKRDTWYKGMKGFYGMPDWEHTTLDKGNCSLFSTE